MALGHSENFHFQKSPILTWGAGGLIAVDEVTEIRAYSPMVALNGTVSEAYCEPQQLQTVGNENHRLDNLSRIIVFASRSALTAPSMDIKIGREGETPISLPPVLPSLLGAETPVFFDGILPNDFCKAAASAALDDEVYVSCDVDPGEAGVCFYGVTVLLVPGFVAGDSNKGANLSAPQYLTNR